LVNQPSCLANLTNLDSWCSCRAYLPDGSDNSQQLTYIDNQLDWGQAFVGQYDLASVQYRGYRGYHNNIAMYWKGSHNMNFQYDGLAAHVKNSTFYYERTLPRQSINMALVGLFFLNTPGLSGTILLEDIIFKGD